jgi:hypothetical protein
MTMSHEAYLLTLADHPIVNEALFFIAQMGSKYDPDPNVQFKVGLSPEIIDHSLGVASISGIVANELELPFESAVVLTSAGIRHDGGKTFCLPEVHSKKYKGEFTDHSTHRLRSHSHWGYELAKGAPEDRQNTFKRKIAVLGLLHHTGHTNQDEDYPSVNELEVYVGANEVSHAEICAVSPLIPVFSTIDGLEALLNKKGGRDYQQERLAAEEGMSEQLTPEQAADLVAAQILQPSPHMTAHDVLKIMLDNADIINSSKYLQFRIR